MEIFILSILYLWFICSLWPFPFVQVSDGYWLWVPRLTFAVKEILNGKMPFWNEYQFCGTTLLADGNTNIFNPLTLLYFFMSSDWAYTLEVIFLFAFLITTTWLYFRERGFSKEASIIGTIGYVYSGQVLFWSIYHGMNLSLGLFPCMLLAFRKFEKTKRKIWRIFAFILIFLSAIGGFIQFTFIAALSCLVEGLERFSFKEVKRIIRYRFFTVILALFSAAFIIMPIIEASVFSHRKFISYFTELIPNKFHLLPMVLYGTSFNQHGYPNYFYYIGIVLIALSVFAIRKIPKEVIFQPFFLYSLIFPTILFLFFSKNMPLSFQFKIESDPWRGMFIFILSLSILSAKAIDIFVNQQKNGNKFLILPYELLISGIITVIISLDKFELNNFLTSDKIKVFILGVLLISSFILSLILRRKKENLVLSANALLMLSLILFFICFNEILVFTIGLSVLFIITVFFKKSKLFLKSEYLKYCIILLLVANCFPMRNYLVNNVKHVAIEEMNPWEKNVLPGDFFLKKGRVVHIGDGINFEDWGIYNNIRAIGGYGSFFPKTIFLRMKKDRILPQKFDAASHFRNNNVLDLDVLARYGVSYLIKRKSYQIDPLKQGWSFVKETETNLIYSNPKFVGRSYILDEEGNIIKGAVIIKNSSSYVKIAFEANAGDVLILADSWFPGWKCYDNGTRADGFDAEGFRGYRVKKTGFHEVEWVYRSTYFLIGLVMFFISIIIFVKYNLKDSL